MTHRLIGQIADKQELIWFRGLFLGHVGNFVERPQKVHVFFTSVHLEKKLLIRTVQQMKIGQIETI